MKRSEINKALKELEKMIADHQYYLPKFANFTPEEWKTKGHEFDEIRDNMLGWDITDYGMGDFDKYGLIKRSSKETKNCVLPGSPCLPQRPLN